MLFKTPVTMNEALELLAFYHEAHWTLIKACSGVIVSENRWVDAKQKAGRAAVGSNCVRKVKKALRAVQHRSDATMNRLSAERLGGIYQRYDVAARLFCDARLAPLPEDQDELLNRLLMHLQSMDESDWLGSDVISFKYGTDVSEGLARLLDGLGRYTPLVRCMMGWPEFNRVTDAAGV